MSHDLKVLVVSRHYPPAVAGGSRRPYFLARALAEAGVRVCVVAPDPDPDLPSIVIPHPNRDPATGPADATSGRSGSPLRDFARNWALWPDPDVRWASRAVRAVRREAPFTPDWILTTSPPESVHWVGRALKRHFACHWAADFRDHWFTRSFRDIRHNPLRRRLEARVARHMLRPVDRMIAINSLIADEITQLSPPLSAADTLVLPHFAPPLPAPLAFDGPGPHLVHAGSFSLSDPECMIAPVLDAFKQALERRPQLRLHLIGRLTDAECDAARSSVAGPAITCHGLVPLERSLALQQGADALIAVAAPGAPVPPGKLTEYLATRKPVIAFGEASWRDRYGLADIDPVAAMATPEQLTAAKRPPDWQDWRQAGRRLLAHLAAGSVVSPRS